jgi:hypothetical protein
VAKAQAAAEAIVGLRWMDMEGFRLPFITNALRATLGDAAEVAMSTRRSNYQGDPAQLDAEGNVIPNTKGIQFRVMDIFGTIVTNGLEHTNAIIQQAQT